MVLPLADQIVDDAPSDGFDRVHSAADGPSLRGEAALAEGNSASAADSFRSALNKDVSESGAHFGIVRANTQNLTVPVYDEATANEYHFALDTAKDPAARDSYGDSLQEESLSQAMTNAGTGTLIFWFDAETVWVYVPDGFANPTVTLQNRMNLS